MCGKKNLVILGLSTVCILLLILSCTLIWRGGYWNKLLVRVGIKEDNPEINWALKSWDNCLEQMKYDADIVFLGDSITYGGDWQQAFPKQKVVNLGYPGDSLVGMIDRISLVENVHPETVIIMGGINGLKYYGIDTSIKYYTTLIQKLQDSVPEATIIVQSLLPIAVEKEKNYGSNKNIEEFNSRLYELADEHRLKYLDVYRLYEENGCINTEMTTDGLHIKECAYLEWYNLLREVIQ